MTGDAATLRAAGRRAAYAELRIQVNNIPGSRWEASEPEAYEGVTSIVANGADISSAIDAAVMETVARLTAPNVELPEPLAKLRYLRPGVLPL